MNNNLKCTEELRSYIPVEGAGRHNYLLLASTIFPKKFPAHGKPINLHLMVVW